MKLVQPSEDAGEDRSDLVACKYDILCGWERL